ncbi:DUF4352 domain-containing protein [Heyndrickxia sporothermodurans]|uniref:DUF4352 domain-containing protein n=1 Tax=Heyndrickxia sporothermodurans TaxID=46224 RepID=UPI002DBC6FAF|nr:DUF4352 domain-containing protein [Heyndrickxia sporothermodurans]MEB6548993.1 DUF4352 domain-containing protein [Heyndrickxia sporothermodurans]
MKKLGKLIITVIGVFIVIGIIGSMVGKDEEKTSSEPSKKVTASETKVNKEAKKKTESKIYKVGDLVKVGKLAYKVSKVSATSEIKSDNEFIKSAKTDGQFIMISIEAFNKDKKARMVDSTMFKIKDDQGREFDPTNDSEVMMVADEAMEFFLQDINPGVSKKGLMIFELPKDSAHYSLEVSSGFGWAGGKYEEIKLK